jgi:hypothetical protein
LNHAAPPPAAEHRRPSLPFALLELALRLQHALVVIAREHRRSPLLSFALFEAAAVIAGTVIAFALLRVVA